MTITYIDFSVAAQDTSPIGIFFKPGGLKMYMIGSQKDSVNEYDLSIAYDLSSMVFLQSFDVSAQDSNPHGVFFKPDGLKMYMVGEQSLKVHEYDLSIAWDVLSAVFLQSFDVSAQDVGPNAFLIRPDGLKMYMAGSFNQSIFEYDFSSPWNILTLSFLQSFNITSEDKDLHGLFIRPDGLKMYVSERDDGKIHEYDLSAWDVSTASFYQSFIASAQDNDPQDVSFGPDGLKMYMAGIENKKIYQYNVNTAWNVSSIDLFDGLAFGVSGSITDEFGVASIIDEDGQGVEGDIDEDGQGVEGVF